MNTKKIVLGTAILGASLTGCGSRYDDADLILPTEYDKLVIPDSYNTGAAPDTAFKKFSGEGEIVQNVILQLRDDTHEYNLSGYKNKNLPDEIIIRDYDFSDHNFVIMASDRYSGNKHITFENCKFKGFRNDAAAPGASRVYVTFNNCSFGGNVSSSYITLNNCKIGGFTSDAINPVTDYHANNLYIYDLMHEGNEKGTHLDGIQIYGDQRSRNNVVDEKWVSQVELGNISFNNVRFEIPSIHFATNTSAVNACVMFQLEFSDVDNVSFENLWVNGGGKWYPLYMDHGKNNERSVNGAWSHKNLSMKNVKVSNNFGKIFYPDFLEDAQTDNIDHHDELMVSSVWKDDSGVVHIIASNDTNSDKTLVCKTHRKSYEFTIPHCPSNWALNGETDGKTNPDEALADNEGKSYMEYTWADMPFDREFLISGDPDFVVCYQDGRQIRYLSFDGEDHYYPEIKE